MAIHLYDCINRIKCLSSQCGIFPKWHLTIIKSRELFSGMIQIDCFTLPTTLPCWALSRHQLFLRVATIFPMEAFQAIIIGVSWPVTTSLENYFHFLYFSNVKFTCHHHFLYLFGLKIMSLMHFFYLQQWLMVHHISAFHLLLAASPQLLKSLVVNIMEMVFDLVSYSYLMSSKKNIVYVLRFKSIRERCFCLTIYKIEQWLIWVSYQYIDSSCVCLLNQNSGADLTYHY